MRENRIAASATKTFTLCHVQSMLLRLVRAPKLYDLDKRRAVRFSHENPEIKKLYADYLGKPLSEKAHELLHVHG